MGGFGNSRMHIHKYTHSLSLVVYNTVQYKQWVHTWSICQSYLQMLQRKLQRRPGPDTHTHTHTHTQTHKHTHEHRQISGSACPI